jgi:signal transduction histidine kinase
MPEQRLNEDSLDDVDGLAGLPTGALTAAKSENAEIYVAQLGKWLEVRSRYLNWVDGRLAQMVIATDITPRRMAEELSAAQAERAHSASRLITMGEMASSVAHELNQPLTAINNYCSGMVTRIKDKKITDEDLLGALEKTSRQAQRAGQIIQRIRTFVKRSEPNTHGVRRAGHGGGGGGAGRDRIPPAQRAPDPPHRRAPAQPAGRPDPDRAGAGQPHEERGGVHRFRRGRPRAGNVELRVVPKIEEGLRAVEFSVTDTGQGLAPEVMERLFEAFFSTKAEGMGIGLNLCRSIVESHHGRMQARNLYNGQEVVGCCFSFWIPVTDSQQTDAFKDSGVTA